MDLHCQLHSFPMELKEQEFILPDAQEEPSLHLQEPCWPAHAANVSNTTNNDVCIDQPRSYSIKYCHSICRCRQRFFVSEPNGFRSDIEPLSRQLFVS